MKLLILLTVALLAGCYKQPPVQEHKDYFPVKDVCQRQYKHCQKHEYIETCKELRKACDEVFHKHW